uniref:Si:ch211-262i1.4 n=1 Tax=Electrophorus electricus TaxID=8005 RepID=A0A4W4HN74_ELEEL
MDFSILKVWKIYVEYVENTFLYVIKVPESDIMERLLNMMEPVVVIHKLGASFFEMALTLTVYNRSLETAGGQVEQAQTASSRFFLLHSVISTMAAMLSIVPLGRVADRRGPKVFLVVSQLGSVLGMCFLLLFLFCDLPVEFLFLGTAVYGLCGGSPAYWAGVVALAALSSRRRSRTLKLNVVDMCVGVAGVLGGLLSGYVYRVGHQGAVLLGAAITLSTLSLLLSVFFLPTPRGDGEEKEELLREPTGEGRPDAAAGGLLMTAMVVFILGMVGAEDVLTLYVLKPPLSWDSVWAGYGSAATNAMYVSSFLGVLVLSRVLGDTALSLLGIMSNCTGMAIMAFTIRNTNRENTFALLLVLGRTFGRLQLVLAVTELVSTVFFASVYPLTLHSCSGVWFLLSCAISYLSVIPIL